MERFYKRKQPETSSSNKISEQVNLDDLPWDPSERKPISSYHPNKKDEVRRAYLIRGPCQPRGHEFPKKMVSGRARRFRPDWFDQYGNWLEYSVKTDKAFCLCCYLFKDGGSPKDAFVTDGFSNWNKTDRFMVHVGDVNSFHNNSVKKCEDLLRQNQSIPVAFEKQCDKQKYEYRIILGSSVSLSKQLLNGGLSFRGHDESEESFNRGNFLEFLKWIGEQNEEIGKVILKNAPGNLQMTSPKVQKDICNCFAQEVLKQVFEELGDDVFSLLVDESSDISKKEQMAVVLRYVDKHGILKERFIGLVHVMETSALSLKYAIDDLFSRYKLSLTKVRGQGYDGASNMAGEFNGLKALILKENPSAYYVHCFAHQLQLVVVAVANKHTCVWNFFEAVGKVTNVICASCKRQDMLRESQRKKLEDAIGRSIVDTGSGLNQEISLARAGDTRWSSHYKTLTRLASLYSSVFEVLKYVEESGHTLASQKQADGLQVILKSFDFVFYLHLMIHVLGATHSLSQALQRKDQDLLNAVSLVNTTKQKLQKFRADGFCSFLEEVISFCEEHDIVTVNMNNEYINPKNKRQRTNITYHHYYEFDCFNTVLDMQIQEFGDRFNEVTSELLMCMGTLTPCDNFREFDIRKTLRLAEMYPSDFDDDDKRKLKFELATYIDNLKADERFVNLNGLSALVRLMVETKKHLSFPLVYRLLKLSLVLPVATASVERCFSSMKYVKSDLRNRIGDEYLNDCCICYIEKELLRNVTIEDVMHRFQKMKTRRGQL